MPRADPLGDHAAQTFDPVGILSEHGVPAEAKPTSFGKLNGRIVVIDYGDQPE